MSKPSNVNNSVNLDICLGESYAGLKTTNSEKYNYSNYELGYKFDDKDQGTLFFINPEKFPEDRFFTFCVLFAKDAVSKISLE